MYKVAIKELATGETRICAMTVPWNDHSEWWWTEGNFGCDCNRQATFKGDEEYIDAECNIADNKYLVLYAELPDGTRIAIDTPEAADGGR